MFKTARGIYGKKHSGKRASFFTIEVLERVFKSNDLRMSANNLRKDRASPTAILDDIDIAKFTAIPKESLSIKNKSEQNRVIERILNEIKGRMSEETKHARPDAKVFKFQSADGECDMVICNPKTEECEIGEIKYRQEAFREQARHLLNQEKCLDVERRFGIIMKKPSFIEGVASE